MAENIPARNINYNISGQGQLRTYMYPHTVKLYDFLCKYNFDKKFYSTKQLGAIQYLLKGAHHTRYEYILLQWTLIHQLKIKAQGSGLNSKTTSQALKLNGYDNHTRAEILQCLCLLTNMGHFPDTFSASKLWMHLLYTNKKNIRSTFKKGLGKEGKKLLDTALEEYDFYNIHLINSLFLLDRYRKASGNEDTVNFSKAVLKEFLNGESEEMEKFWGIYKSIRKIAFVILDSHYAPIPFNLDFSSIILNLEHYQEAIIDDESIFQKALDQINIVLENSLYLEANSLLISRVRSLQIYKEFNNLTESKTLDKVSDLKKLLEPSADNSEYKRVFQLKAEVDPARVWNLNILDLTYEEVNFHLDLFPKDLFDFENVLTQKNGQKTSLVATSYPPSKKSFRLVIGTKDNLGVKKNVITVMDIIKNIIDFNEDLIEKGYKKNYQSEKEFKEKIFKFFLTSIYGNEKDFTLEYLPLTKSPNIPLFIGKGSVNLATEISRYIESVKKYLNSDQIHEMQITREAVKKLNYRGLIIAYTGATKVRKKNESKYESEFDGIIILPNQKQKNFFYVVEAKNKANGNTEAKAQLTERLINKLDSAFEVKLENIGNKGAVAEVSLK